MCIPAAGILQWTGDARAMVVFYLERSAVLDQQMLMYLRWTFDLPAVALIADTMAVGREVPHPSHVSCVHSIKIE